MTTTRTLLRKLGIALGSIVLLLLVCVVVMLGPYAMRVRRIPANPAAGFHADGFVYVSPGARRIAKSGGVATLLVQPNNSGITSDRVEVHRNDAWWTGFGRHALADELGVVLLVPAFVRPATGWQVYTHALDRDVLTTDRLELRRLDLQLLAMIDRARSVLATGGVRTDERFLIQGYSASGMFANRFAALHPRRVKAVAAGSPGGWPIAPVAAFHGEPLRYPAGIADLDSLTGQPFDSLGFSTVPQLIVMGSRDDNDGLDFRDGWDEAAAAQVDRLFGKEPQARWAPAQALYQTAGANAQFLRVDGVGHDRRALQHYSTAFFRALLKPTPSPVAH